MIVNENQEERLLEKYYSTLKTKKYYNTTQIMKMTGICKRTMRTRIKELRVKYENIPSLIHIKKDKWQIHRCIADQFLPKNKPRINTIYNQDWQSFITWVTLDNFDDAYHHQLAHEIGLAIPAGKFRWVLEQTDLGVNHVHMITDMKKDEVIYTINGVLNQYIPTTEYRLEVEPIRSKIMTIEYMLKQN